MQRNIRLMRVVSFGQVVLATWEPHATKVADPDSAGLIDLLGMQERTRH